MTFLSIRGRGRALPDRRGDERRGQGRRDPPWKPETGQEIGRRRSSRPGRKPRRQVVNPLGQAGRRLRPRASNCGGETSTSVTSPRPPQARMHRLPRQASGAGATAGAFIEPRGSSATWSSAGDSLDEAIARFYQQRTQKVDDRTSRPPLGRELKPDPGAAWGLEPSSVENEPVGLVFQKERGLRKFGH